MTKTMNALTERARRKLLTDIKEAQLDKLWTPQGSELVDRIDEVIHAKN